MESGAFGRASRADARPASLRRWRLIAVVTCALAATLGTAAWLLWSTGQPLPAEARADRVIVIKHERSLLLQAGGLTIKRYRIALGQNPEGHKQAQGDGRTPEGLYRIDWRNPRSRYHRSLHVSYPNAADRQRAARAGVNPGGDIMIHGLPARLGWIGPLHRALDWTDGCVALTNAEVDELWRAVADGTPIDIRP
jgi:murein L,D-transpeptidase YafK